MDPGKRIVFERFLDLLYPPICLFCGEISDWSEEPNQTEFTGSFFWNPTLPCRSCSEKLTTPEGRFCPRCSGRRFYEKSNRVNCSRCRTTDFLFDRAIALGEYEAEFRAALLRMKTDKSGRWADTLTSLLIRKRGNMLREIGADLIVPVPSHRMRRWERGVNPPDLIAGHLARFLQISNLNNQIRRNRATELQYILSNRARRANVVGAFDLVPSWKSRSVKENSSSCFADKKVLLVDDILTTGATCNELTRFLRKHGAKSVTVCVLARAEGRSSATSKGFSDKIITVR